MDHLCCSVLSRLLIAALWSPAWKGLTSWLSFVVLYCEIITVPIGILCQVWYLIVLIHELFLILSFILYA